MKMSFFSLLIILVLTGAGAFATQVSFTYQGRIIKPNGSPLEYSNVSFAFSITNQADTCTLYREQVSGIDMRSSGGVFDVAIGTGVRNFPTDPSISIKDVFKNSVTLDCAAGGTNTPSEYETRL